VPESFDRLTRVLSDSESERATRFHFLRDATRSVMSRVVLRALEGPPAKLLIGQGQEPAF